MAKPNHFTQAIDLAYLKDLSLLPVWKRFRLAKNNPGTDVAGQVFNAELELANIQYMMVVYRWAYQS